MADGDLAGPPPREAIDYLLRKGMRTGWDYRDVWREEHAVAFTVANMMRVDLLADVRESITRAQAEGTPAAAWKRGLTAELRKRGWWGRLAPPDPDDDQAMERADLYISRRLDTIWRVNTRQAAQAGAWERGQRSTSHPYVLYRVGPSRRHREQHLRWDGVLLRKDDPFWGVANPSNGWGCKCYTRFVSEAQYERHVRQGIPAPAQGDGAGAPRKKVQTKSPELRAMRYHNGRTGEVHTGYEGIDPGFERNPGVGRLEQLGRQFRRSNRSLALAWDVRPGRPTAARPHVRPVGTALDVQLTDPATARSAEAAIDEIGAVHSDGDLPRIPVKNFNESNPFTTKFSGLFQPRWDSGLGRDTAGHIEIRDGSPTIVVAHEVGHFIDFSGLGRDGHYQSQYPDESRYSEDEARATARLMRLLLADIQKTAAYKGLRGKQRAEEQAAAEAADDQQRQDHEAIAQDIDQYWCQDIELFARAYAQYVAWRAGDQRMLDDIDARLGSADPVRQLSQWAYADFLPLIYRFDTLFEAQGWLTRTRIEP